MLDLVDVGELTIESYRGTARVQRPACGGHIPCSMSDQMFRLRAHAWIPAAAAFLSLACAAKPVAVSPPVRPASAHVVLYDGLPLPPYRKIREVRTVACARQLGRKPDLAAARDQLRVEAARLGGNAVGNIMCHHESARLGSPCWKIAQCTGEVECASSATNRRVSQTCQATARR